MNFDKKKSWGNCEKKEEVGSETKDRIDESEIEDDMDTGWSQVEGGRIKSVEKTTKKRKKYNEEDSVSIDQDIERELISEEERKLK